MATGNEKCTGCKKVPFPQGWEPTLQKCWFCAFPNVGVVLTEAQRAFVEASWE